MHAVETFIAKLLYNGYTVITKALFIPILGMGMMNLICWKSDDCVMLSSLGT